MPTLTVMAFHLDPVLSTLFGQPTVARRVVFGRRSLPALDRVLWRMGRAARVLLLAFAVVVLSAAPGRDAGGLDADTSSSAAVLGASQQLSSGLPIARSDGARLPAVDVGGWCDRVDPRTRQVSAVLPGVVVASPSAVGELVEETIQVRVGTVATCACGRGPPAASLLTSI